MLEQRVVDAVAQGQFAIYTVSSVNEALALLIKKDPADYVPQGLLYLTLARLLKLKPVLVLCAVDSLLVLRKARAPPPMYAFLLLQLRQLF